MRNQKKVQLVFVTRSYITDGIIEDEVIEMDNNKFKSIKYRHTYYIPGDFFLNYKEALRYCLDQKRAQILVLAQQE